MLLLKLLALWCSFLWIVGDAFAADKLVIISPHRKSIQQEYIPSFKKYYRETFKTDIEVDWLDQGGTADDIRFVRAKFASNPKTSGLDIFFGGGTATFVELDRDKALAPIKIAPTLAKELPDSVAGMPLRNSAGTWYASALSTFGLFFNRKVLEFEKFPEPKKWADLADPVYFDQLSLADPRRSGTANTLNTIILQSRGWDKGWQLLTTIAGNNRGFTHSSSDPIKAVVSGDAIASTVIDFYALAKIGDLGSDKLGFVAPEGETILDPDPIAVLRGAPNPVAALRFVEYVLSAPAQKLLMLPKGAEGGPKFESLGRLAVNTAAYEGTDGKRVNTVNPFQQTSFIKLDFDKASKLKRVFDDLIGAILVDTHRDLRKAWGRMIKRGYTPEEFATLTAPPVTEDELLKLAERWDDNEVRNKTINSWVEFARSKYQKIATSK